MQTRSTLSSVHGQSANVVLPGVSPSPRLVCLSSGGFLFFDSCAPFVTKAYPAMRQGCGANLLSCSLHSLGDAVKVECTRGRDAEQGYLTVAFANVSQLEFIKCICSLRTQSQDRQWPPTPRRCGMPAVKVRVLSSAGHSNLTLTTDTQQTSLPFSN